MAHNVTQFDDPTIRMRRDLHQFCHGALVWKANKSAPIKVNNLGWLLRRAGNVVQFRVCPTKIGDGFELLAYLNDGSVYGTWYASWDTATRLFWFNGKRFDGVKVEVIYGEIDGLDLIASDRIARRLYTICGKEFVPA